MSGLGMKAQVYFRMEEEFPLVLRVAQISSSPTQRWHKGVWQGCLHKVVAVEL